MSTDVMVLSPSVFILCLSENEKACGAGSDVASSMDGP